MFFATPADIACKASGKADAPGGRQAHLDVEQRIVASRVIKRFIMHARRTAFVVEHDFIMATSAKAALAC